MELTKTQFDYKKHVIFLVSKKHNLRDLGLAEGEIHYAREKIQNDEKNTFFFNKFDKKIFVAVLDTEKEDHNKIKEKARLAGGKINKLVNSEKIEEIQFQAPDVDKNFAYAFLEGLLMANYKYLKFKTKDIDKQKLHLNSILITDDKFNEQELTQLKTIVEGVHLLRDLVNEPYPQLNSETLAQKAQELAKEVGLEVQTLYKKEIEELGMGGLLAVNQGSKYQPTFTILTWKPENHKNEKPIILVGKGIVFDTGGLNLKPTGYIETMKQDMAGAATVIATLYTIAKLNLPLYVIGLVPSTDNAISDRSYAPGQIIKIMDGTTVEVKNTDAEGRLILADALAYAKKYQPMLVIDLATLTGAAIVALGHLASALYSTADQELTQKMLDSGFETYERLVQLPLWDEYKDLLKSDIADISNLGGKYGGSITAAKFLETFTDYPWMHLDIAPVAFTEDNKPTDYQSKGATGYGLRLLINFLSKLA